ncbi:MAG: hypothetical protein AVDCRST_MAG56-1850, partial [uncultured Cytophagales bacterium]
ASFRSGGTSLVCRFRAGKPVENSCRAQRAYLHPLPRLSALRRGLQGPRRFYRPHDGGQCHLGYAEDDSRYGHRIRRRSGDDRRVHRQSGGGGRAGQPSLRALVEDAGRGNYRDMAVFLGHGCPARPPGGL